MNNLKVSKQNFHKPSVPLAVAASELQSESDATPIHQQLPVGFAFLVGETKLLHWRLLMSV